MNDKKLNLAILILIGGKSTRFGKEKAVIKLFDKPLILHQIETLEAFDEDVYLVAHSEEQVFRYKKEIDFPEDIPFIIDDKTVIQDPKFTTPVLGIYSGLKELDRLNFKKVFLLSCDMPLIKPEVVKYMIHHSEVFQCCIPRWEHGYLEPFFAIYPVKETLERVKSNIKNKVYGITNLIDKNWKVHYVSVEKEIKPLDEHLVSLININGPIDLEQLMGLYKKT